MNHTPPQPAQRRKVETLPRSNSGNPMMPVLMKNTEDHRTALEREKASRTNVIAVEVSEVFVEGRFCLATLRPAAERMGRS